MIILKRIPVIIFAIMIFGAFANFAQNVWGNGIIILCQIALAVVFLAQIVVGVRQTIREGESKMSKAATGAVYLMLLSGVPLLLFNGGGKLIDSLFIGLFCLLVIFVPLFVLIAALKKVGISKLLPVLENYFIFIGFMGAAFKNMSLLGASILSVLGIVGLFLFYLFYAARYAVNNFKSGRTITLLLCTCFLSAFLLGFSVLFRIQHLPGGQIIQYLGIGLSILIVLLSVKRKFAFRNVSINLVQGLQMQKNNFFLIYTVAFVFCSYNALKQAGIAPEFYSQYYPGSTYKLGSDAKISEEKDVYQHFIASCRENGFMQ